MMKLVNRKNEIVQCKRCGGDEFNEQDKIRGEQTLRSYVCVNCQDTAPTLWWGGQSDETIK